MAVRKRELTDRGVVASELTMPWTRKVIGVLTQIERWKTGDPVVISWEVTVVDRTISP